MLFINWTNKDLLKKYLSFNKTIVYLSKLTIFLDLIYLKQIVIHPKIHLCVQNFLIRLSDLMIRLHLALKTVALLFRLILTKDTDMAVSSPNWNPYPDLLIFDAG